MTSLGRTCTEILPQGERRAGLALEDIRDRPAYVLLGEPGAGKTTAFGMEAAAAGTEPVSARDFIALPPRPEWLGKPIFIDGLDEVRAGSIDNVAPLDAIRHKLLQIGQPVFRLSCREADWLGSDREHLDSITPQGVAVFHLDDLTDEQVGVVLSQDHRIPDPDAFMESARARGLEALLRNPQNLGMLAEAVHDGWPDNLKDAFELACRRLAHEHNRQRRDVTRNRRIAADKLLDAAGQLYAIQLLGGLAGFALDEDAATAAYPALQDLGLDIGEALRQALESRLFAGHGNVDRREPAHRRIAEFLAARYVTRQIDHAGLPLGRIRAVMEAGDGGVVSDLRGLHAWLAVLFPSARRTLVEADPLGVVLYGDVRAFTADDKRCVLNALSREALRYPWFRSQDWNAPPFGALADRESVDHFREILESPDRSQAHESLVDCVLEAIRHGDPLPELCEALLAIARDRSRWPTNRKAAIQAYIHATDGGRSRLRALLDDISGGRVPDGDDELTGILLTELYPVQLSPAEIVDYLHTAKDPRLIGHYLMFWDREFLERTPIDEIPQVTDRFAEAWTRLRRSLDDFHLKRLAGGLLVKALQLAGEFAAPERVWRWLGMGLDEHAYSRLDKKHQQQITDWLSERQQILRELLEFSFAQCAPKKDVLHCLLETERRIYDARVAPDTADWLFEQAAGFDSAEARNFLFNRGAMSLLRRLDYTPGLLDALLSVSARHPKLQPNVKAWLRCNWDDWRREDAQWKRNRSSEAERRVAEWQAFVRKHHDAIEAGSAHPKIMHDLAMVYFGRFQEAEGENAEARMHAWLGGDAGMVLTALTGLRRTLAREDLPTVSEIIKLALDNRHHYIAEASLAGAEEWFQDNPVRKLELDDEVLTRLVCFRLTHDYGAAPAWFQSLVAQRPGLVADVLVAYASAMLKAGKEHVAGIFPLAYDDHYRDVSRLAALKLLAAYPARAKRQRLGDLGTLLVAALRHCDRQKLVELIAAKLSRKSLDVAQRSQWLCAGLLLDPIQYEGPLSSYVDGNQARSMLIARFFSERPAQATGLPELSESTLVMLIRSIGPYTTPVRPTGAYTVTAEMNAADLVRGLIARLSNRATDSASKAFTELLNDESLHAWRDRLREHQESQRVVLREARFRYPSASAIARLLENGPPAHPADLKALLAQHLRDLDRSDRDGNTTGYRRYWNIDEYGRPTSARTENDCRDRLLELLRERVRGIGVELMPEGEYRENRRADIRASFGGTGGFNVPIEIKRDSHKDLWLAWRTQLLDHYVRDPGADGHGIYLIFWFGGRGMPVAADGGSPPRCAGELESRLSALLSESEKPYIDVIVLDCEPPSTSRGSEK
ncbi:hypothetical protein SAMN05421829_10621 [Aromatoleum tolulyticum]|uniref:Uncharacterized protein n=1 Tax=Aromatoleum tolulyticum TaxID=34027 RepID=A0A1N6URV7_9RHOO|nr:hypothetical protein [Aromatoleum tolulyticum]SIQ68327.1 hypothetical protein SAMN05421829_10621 [Aromatoleum tolulyticum]